MSEAWFPRTFEDLALVPWGKAVEAALGAMGWFWGQPLYVQVAVLVALWLLSSLMGEM